MAVLQKETCDLRHPLHLRYPLDSYSGRFWEIRILMSILLLISLGTSYACTILYIIIWSQVSFCKTATNYKTLLRDMTNQDNAYYICIMHTIFYTQSIPYYLLDERPSTVSQYICIPYYIHNLNIYAYQII